MLTSLHTHSVSPPHADLVTVRTLASPINPADINQIQGTYPVPVDFTTALSTPQPCAVPGNEGVFEVTAVGAKVHDLTVGDWVLPRFPSLGTWRSALQTESSNLWKIPSRASLDVLSAACLSVNPVTAWCLLKMGNLRPGDWYVQNGANSAVGRMVIQFGKLWGLQGISIIRPRDTKDATERLKEELRQLGARDVILPDEIVSLEKFRPKLALNCLGGPDAAKMAQKLSPGGQCITYGGMTKLPMRLGAGPFIFSDLTFKGFWLTRFAKENPDAKEDIMNRILALMKAGKLTLGPMETASWGQLDSLRSAIQRRGKTVFVF